MDAVKSVSPSVDATDVSQELVLLCRSCLTKDPSLRLQLVSWEHFDPSSAQPITNSAALNRIQMRQSLARGAASRDPVLNNRTRQTTRRTLSHVNDRLQALVRKECVGNEIFPPATMIDAGTGTPSDSLALVQFEASLDHSLAHNFQIWIAIKLLDVAAVVH